MTISDERRPVIGLAASDARARWRVWDDEVVLLPRHYVDKIVAAGGVPLLVPPVAGLAEALLPRLDALVLCGGPDVDPARYGASPHERTDAPHPERDLAELQILDGALAVELPVLGICRGLQVLNVARGGTLLQHLPDRVGHERHAPFRSDFGRHRVEVEAGSRLADILGGTTVASAPTYHHQAVDEPGKGLVVTAHCQDGVIEAVEDPSLPFCVAVQWHPEMGEDLSLFTALVAAARAAA